MASTCRIFIVPIRIALNLNHVLRREILRCACTHTRILHQTLKRFSIVKPFSHFGNIGSHFQIISFTMTTCSLLFIFPKTFLIRAERRREPNMLRLHHTKPVNVSSFFHSSYRLWKRRNGHLFRHPYSLCNLYFIRLSRCSLSAKCLPDTIKNTHTGASSLSVGQPVLQETPCRI